MRHLLPHRWHVVGVDWGVRNKIIEHGQHVGMVVHYSTQPHTCAHAICRRRGCAATKTKEFAGANLTVEAARRAW